VHTNDLDLHEAVEIAEVQIATTITNMQYRKMEEFRDDVRRMHDSGIRAFNDADLEEETWLDLAMKWTHGQDDATGILMDGIVEGLTDETTDMLFAYLKQETTARDSFLYMRRSIFTYCRDQIEAAFNEEIAKLDSYLEDARERSRLEAKQEKCGVEMLGIDPEDREHKRHDDIYGRG
jgi:hypothetical protein